MALEPITREEMFMANSAGQNVEIPEPITRREKYLKYMADNSVSKYFGESTEVLFDQGVELADDGGIGMVQIEADLMHIGSTATVTFDGVAYECDVVNPMPETKAIGNFGLIGEGEDNGMPFCVMIMQGVVMICGQVGTHSLKIESIAVKTIDDKYLPRMSFVVRIIEDGAGRYADRKFADMFKAYLSGKTVSLVNGGVVYSLVLCDESFMRFIGFTFSVGTSSASLTVDQVDITNDDAVTFISANFNGVKN